MKMDKEMSSTQQIDKKTKGAVSMGGQIGHRGVVPNAIGRLTVTFSSVSPRATLCEDDAEASLAGTSPRPKSLLQKVSTPDHRDHQAGHGGGIRLYPA